MTKIAEAFEEFPMSINVRFAIVIAVMALVTWSMSEPWMPMWGAVPGVVLVGVAAIALRPKTTK